MTGPGADEALTRSPLIEFAASAAFRFAQHNAGPSAAQAGRAGARYITSSAPFANQVLLKHPQVFRLLSTATRLPCLPQAQWRRTSYSSKRVLFLLPSQALGDNVGVAMFLQAFRERHRPRALGVFCAGSSADIYLLDGTLTVYTLWLAADDLRGWDLLIDLGQLPGQRDIDIWPIDQEAALLGAFGLAPSGRYPAAARALATDRRLSIGVLPLASSPLRSLPAGTTLALVEALAARGAVTLCLNRHQQQGVAMARAIAGRLPLGVATIDVFPSVGNLLRAIDGFDYAVFADSGPAHISKLFAVPGVAVYTSAPGEVLQGRFRNLARWTVPFVGPHCRAPCGLAKLRQDAAGQIGCMGSLGVPLAALPATPNRQDAATAERLSANPVPCVAALAADSTPLVDFVVADLAARLSLTRRAGDPASAGG
jgi:hypothetical protein